MTRALVIISFIGLAGVAYTTINEYLTVWESYYGETGKAENRPLAARVNP